MRSPVILSIVFASFIGLLAVTIGGWVQDNVILATVVILILLNISFVYRYAKSRPTSSLYSNIVVMFVLAYTLYAIMYPVNFALGNVSGPPQNVVMSSVFLYGIGDVALLSTMVILQRKRIALDRVVAIDVVDKDYSFLRRPAILFVFLGMGLMFYNQVKLGGLGSIGMANRMKAFDVARHLSGMTLSVPWDFTLTAAFLALAFSIESKRGIRFLFVVLGSLSIYLFFGLGSRNEILLICWPSLAVLLDKGSIKIKGKWSVIVGIFILASLSPVISNFRNAIITGQSLSSLPSSAWVYSSGETGTAFQITDKIITTSPWTGADPAYLTSILYSLPQSIYGILFNHSKPFNLSTWFVENYYYGMFSRGGGMGFSPIAQAWMDGGMITIIIVFVVAGAILVRLKSTSFMKYILLPSVVIFQRSSFDDVFHQILDTTVIFFIIYGFGQILTRQNGHIGGAVGNSRHFNMSTLRQSTEE